jgi:hypothetical protein
MSRRFAEVDAAGASPLYERVAGALSESGEALRAVRAEAVGRCWSQGRWLAWLAG